MNHRCNSVGDCYVSPTCESQVREWEDCCESLAITVRGSSSKSQEPRESEVVPLDYQEILGTISVHSLRPSQLSRTSSPSSSSCSPSSTASCALTLNLSVFWRYWLYYLNPSTYWIGGVLAATLNNTPIRCAPQEAAYFNPPPGSTCSAYAQAFVDSATGYLTNPDATTNCGYCQYSSGVDYMRTLNIEPKDKWRYFGIFLAFCISNWALVYFFIYTVRIRGWSFGFGYVFGGLGKVVGAVKGLFKGKGKKQEAKET